LSVLVKWGFNIASRLALENKDVVVIDSRSRGAEAAFGKHRCSDHLRFGKQSRRTLEAAGIREAEIMLAVTDSDEVNLVACLVVDTLSPGTKKLARLRAADFDRYRMRSRPTRPISKRSSTPISRWFAPSNA
jgi:trk system potassium uptake protein TrkA